MKAGLGSALSKAEANRFQFYRSLGYLSLLPVLPPGVELWPNCQAAKKLERGLDSRGKSPGVLRDGRWTGLREWQTQTATEEDLISWAAMKASVGLRLDGLIAIDIDATDEQAADIAERIALKHFGRSPLRVGLWPKRVLLYALGGELGSQAVVFKGPSGANEKIEILCGPKQIVIDGLHQKTGRPYEWRRSLPPKTELTKVTPGQLTAFMNEMVGLLPAASKAAGSSSVDRAKVDQESLKGDPELVRKAVMALPNAPELFPTYDDMVRVGQAIHAATIDDPDLGEELWHEWYGKWPDYTPEMADHYWRTFYAPHSVGAGFLYKLADQHSGGVFNRAEQWWQEPVEYDPLFPEEGIDNVNATVLWPEPVDIFGDSDPAELAEPPANSLPDIIDRWSSTEARRKGVPRSFAAVAAITVVGAAIGSSLRIWPRLHDDGWTEPAALWAALIADPGSAKSPTISAAVEPLRRLDDERWMVDNARHQAWHAAQKKKGKDARDLGPEPKVRRSVVDDVTMERQVRIHADNPRGILRAPDELVGLFAAMGAYKKGADGDRSQLLRMFDGGGIMVDRVGAGSIRADRALMGIVAGTQPDKIMGLTRDLGSDGMLQRFLFVMDDGVDRRGIDEAPDHGALSDYASAVRGLATAEYGLADPIRLSAAAHRVMHEAGEAISKLRHVPGASGAWKGHVEKWGKFLPRLTLIFHALDQWSLFGGVVPTLEVDESTARKAVSFARFVLRHSLTFYERCFGASATADEARGVAGYLLVTPELKELKRRDIYQARGSLKGPEKGRALQDAMYELEVAGWVDVLERDAKGPSVWRVNPRIHTRFEERCARERIERKRKQESLIQSGQARKALMAEDNLSGESGSASSGGKA
ncbi:DUF3987 domain-containing protein [Microvirga calopogonii]|uniref:DUF3987 domain-containing protein n=1 Tax=Microvirga calopogonii TaxID=2078013 RepID=UPI0013B367A3|nr:DUF3987 domain-containing protein [Microvirga calopogonii]